MKCGPLEFIAVPPGRVDLHVADRINGLPFILCKSFKPGIKVCFSAVKGTEPEGGFVLFLLRLNRIFDFIATVLTDGGVCALPCFYFTIAVQGCHGID